MSAGLHLQAACGDHQTLRAGLHLWLALPDWPGLPGRLHLRPTYLPGLRAWV